MDKLTIKRNGTVIEVYHTGLNGNDNLVAVLRDGADRIIYDPCSRPGSGYYHDNAPIYTDVPALFEASGLTPTTGTIVDAEMAAISALRRIDAARTPDINA